MMISYMFTFNEDQSKYFIKTALELMVTSGKNRLLFKILKLSGMK